MGNDLISNYEFIADCCRYGEGLLSEQAVKKKWRFDDDAWTILGEDEALIEAIELEKTRRVRSGAAKREKAQQLVVQASDVLGEIMRDPGASPKHRIDASKALDAFADPGPARAPDSGEKFSIIIDLGADQRKLKAGLDGIEILEPVNDTPTAPVLAAITA